MRAVSADWICRGGRGYYSANLMPYKNITPPAGDKISTSQGKLNVPDRPVIPFIRGDGTGPDIWAASVRVFDAAVEKAFDGKKKVSWFEVSPDRRRRTNLMNGCRTTRSTHFANTSSASKDR